MNCLADQLLQLRITKGIAALPAKDEITRVGFKIDGIVLAF